MLSTKGQRTRLSVEAFQRRTLEAALARAKSRLNERNFGELGQRLLETVSKLPPGVRRWDRLVVKSGGTTRFLRVIEIDWIEAAGAYANLHASGKELLYRASLSEVMARMDPARFVRIHRSAIVNIESIVQLEPVSHGEFEVVLRDGARTRVSRIYRAQLEKRLGQSL
jgi:two-component system LytT family response regulator